MPKGISKILVTGAAGFIGSEFARQALRKGYEVVVIDKLTYAGDLERLKGTGKEYRFYKADICDKKQIEIIGGVEESEVLVEILNYRFKSLCILCLHYQRILTVSNRYHSLSTEEVMS